MLEDEKEHGGDVIPTLPSISAIFELSKLVPKAPIPLLRPLDVIAHPGVEEDFKSMWATWIDSHQSELQKLKPTAEGIVFDSTYCSELLNGVAMDSRLKTISGQGAFDCGRVKYREDAHKADKCVREKLAAKEAFFVRYDAHRSYDADEIDDLAIGLATDGQHGLYAVGFDDAGVNTTSLGDKAELFDGAHTVVVLCPIPIKLGTTFSKGLTCLRQTGNLLLSPE